jgi:hypothetical protein
MCSNQIHSYIKHRCRYVGTTQMCNTYLCTAHMCNKYLRHTRTRMLFNYGGYLSFQRLRNVPARLPLLSTDD